MCTMGLSMSEKSSDAVIAKLRFIKECYNITYNCILASTQHVYITMNKCTNFVYLCIIMLSKNQMHFVWQQWKTYWHFYMEIWAGNATSTKTKVFEWKNVNFKVVKLNHYLQRTLVENFSQFGSSQSETLKYCFSPLFVN